MSSDDLCFLSIADAAPLIASRQLSPVELLDAHLARIGETDDALNSFITLLDLESRAAAKEAEAEISAGNYRGPLHGIPIGLKDLYYTKGIRTTVGSKIMKDFVPDEDAFVVERFREAGAIIIGKLQMHEFAKGATSENPHYGPAHNPWDTTRITGGSSGGSGAAVAAGQCMGALGSDTGGSVRIPASLCGIVGLKPTFGRVSRIGVYPLSWSLDTVGPMTRTVRDTALIMNVIAGHDARDTSSSRKPVPDNTDGLADGVEGARIGVPEDYFFEDLDPEVDSAVRKAIGVLEELGASVVPVSLPLSSHMVHVGRTIVGAESSEIHMDNLRARPQDFGPVTRQALEAGAMITATHYVRAQRVRTAFARQVNEVFSKVDLLATPTTTMAASSLGEREVTVAGKTGSPLNLLITRTAPFNSCGVPAISLPCGFTARGLPIGLQLAGRPFDEPTVLRVAHAYEQATDWHTRRPPI